MDLNAISSCCCCYLALQARRLWTVTRVRPDDAIYKATVLLDFNFEI